MVQKAHFSQRTDVAEKDQDGINTHINTVSLDGSSASAFVAGKEINEEYQTFSFICTPCSSIIFKEGFASSLHSQQISPVESSIVLKYMYM